MQHPASACTRLIRILQATILLFPCGVKALSQGAYIPPDRPKLVIGIVIEQLRYDQLEKLRDRFSENGIRRLLNEGTYYKNSQYAYVLTQSAPGHATISTGAEPAFHGITSDSWYLPLKDDLTYCTQDNGVDPVGGSYEAGLHSPTHLLSSTFADELSLSSGGQSKICSVGLKESSSILSAGHTRGGVYWYDDISGTFMSSTWYTDSLPGWVNDFNSLKMPETYLNGQWVLSKSIENYRGCQPDSSKFESGFNGITSFPYDLKRLSSKGLINQKKDYSLLRETPFGNSLTTEFALRLISSEKLGRDDEPDFLALNYSANDYIGHRFGPSSFEAADALFRLDNDISRLLKFLNDSIGKRNILIYFTAAHGVAEIPGILEKNRIPSGYFRPQQAIQLLKSYLNAVYGQGDWVKGYHEKQIFLNRVLIEDAKIPLEEIQKKVSRFLVQFSGISSAYPYSAFEANDFGNGNLKRIVNSFSPQRSGDVIITLNPGWIEKNDFVTNHNSPYEYDAHVPLIWYGWAVNRALVTRKVNPTDIAATLSSICRVPYPNSCTGEPLVELMR